MADEGRIEGLEEVARRMRNLPKKLRRKVLNRALRSGATIVRREARRLAPVGESGLLRRSIATRTVPKSRLRVAAQVKVGVKLGRRGRRNQGDAYYWRFPEFGTKHQPAQSFMRKAFWMHRVQAANMIKQKILEGIDREARRP